MARPERGRTNSIRDKFREQLQTKTENSYKSKDQGAGGFKDYFDKDAMEGVKKYRVPKGDVTVVFDVIPYFAGPRDPNNRENDPVYVLDLLVHRDIGPMNEQIVCLAQYGKPCPICDEVQNRRAAGEDYKTVIKPLRATRRVIYNVVIRDNGDEEKKGVQVFEIAHFLMEAKLAGIVKDARTGGITVFSNPDTGKSISFSKRNPTKETVVYDGHRFSDRPVPITDEELAGAHVLDDLIKILDYDTISDLLYGTDTPIGGPSGSDPEQEEGRDRTTAPEKKQEAAEPPEEPEVKEPPQRRKRRPMKVKEETGAPVCPHGGTIGVSIDELEACYECKLYDSCSTIADSL